MNAELEAVLKAYDAFRQAHRSEASRLFSNYQALLEDAAAHSNVSIETLDWAVKRKYLPWVRAQGKDSSLPPKA